MVYQPRAYRKYTESKDLISFKASISETDLFISADRDLSKEAKNYLIGIRGELEAYIASHTDFKNSLKPVNVDEPAPFIIKDMAASAKLVDVGPMAGVAGAVAECIGRELLHFSPQVIVENGGDIFISSEKPRIIGIYAGRSKLSEKIAIEIGPEQTPCGICTSSGTVGHSLSFGKADAVVILSRSTSLADCAATAICNKVSTKDDIEIAINYAKKIKAIEGILVIIGDAFGAWGSIKLVDM